MTLKTNRFDAAEYLDSPQAIQAFLTDAYESGDHQEFLDAIGIAARAKGMTEVARSAGLGRDSLYKGLRSDGNPSFITIDKVCRALGVKLAIAA
ncbi:MAG: putative addiction module antidote protein [Polycyclovorans sp.]|nr:putative addiction module antidote protein [Polycyclovorans sp.]